MMGFVSGIKWVVGRRRKIARGAGRGVALGLVLTMPFLVSGATAASVSTPALGTSEAPNAPAQTSSVVSTNPVFAFTGQVDHVANGVGLRNAGAGVIRLRGAPGTASAVVGILYFGFICTGASCPASQDVNFQGFPVTGVLIGTAPQPCWIGTLYGAYSVDVTPLLSPQINDDYTVDGVPSASTTGADPWVEPPVLPLAEGASLVVVYSDPSLTPGAVYVNDGAVFFSGTVDILNPTVPALTGSARKFTTIGADGQVGSSTFAIPSITGEKTFIGPTAATLTQIAGPGVTSTFGNSDSDWNGSDGGPLPQLWDTHSHSFRGILPASITSYTVRYMSFGDCMDWQAHVLTAR